MLIVIMNNTSILHENESYYFNLIKNCVIVFKNKKRSLIFTRSHYCFSSDYSKKKLYSLSSGF